MNSTSVLDTIRLVDLLVHQNGGESILDLTLEAETVNGVLLTY